MKVEGSVRGSVIKVLIADDEFIVRRAIRRIGRWEEFGMEVVAEAENGIEALEYIALHRPELVILDMRMPGMSGEVILEELQQRKIKVHIIVVSGYDSFEYARRAIRYGVEDYILKPIERMEFNEVLSRISHEIQKEEGVQDLEKTTLLCSEKGICEQIKQDIEQSYRENISLTLFAEKYYINRDVLSRIYKKKYGVGITEYINQVRLEQAKLLLLLGYQITRVAEMVGYKEVNYFSRIFRKKYGMSPSEYVKGETVEKEADRVDP